MPSKKKKKPRIKMEPICLHMDRETYDKIAMMSDAEGMTIGKWLRRRVLYLFSARYARSVQPGDYRGFLRGFRGSQPALSQVREAIEGIRETEDETEE